MSETIDEREFLVLADRQLETIEAALERAIESSDADIDVELKAGGVLELEFTNGSKLIINRHNAAREIWVAARSGGYHFHWDGKDWVNTRDGLPLMTAIARCVGEQAGHVISFEGTN